MNPGNLQLAVNQYGCYIQRTATKYNAVSQYSIHATLERMTSLIMNVIDEFGHQQEHMNYFYQKLLHLNDSFNLGLAMKVSEGITAPIQPSAGVTRIDSIIQELLLLLENFLNAELDEIKEEVGKRFQESCRVVEIVIGCITLTLQFPNYDSFKKVLVRLLNGEWNRQIFDMITKTAKKKFEKASKRKYPSTFGTASDIFEKCLSLFDVNVSCDERSIADYFCTNTVRITISIQTRQKPSTIEKYETSNFAKKVKEMKDVYDLLEKFYPDMKSGTLQSQEDKDENRKLKASLNEYCGCCSAGKEEMTDAHKLPCGHVLCLPCLVNEYQISPNIKCKICRKTLLCDAFGETSGAEKLSMTCKEDIRRESMEELAEKQWAQEELTEWERGRKELTERERARKELRLEDWRRDMLIAKREREEKLRAQEELRLDDWRRDMLMAKRKLEEKMERAKEMEKKIMEEEERIKLLRSSEFQEEFTEKQRAETELRLENRRRHLLMAKRGLAEWLRAQEEFEEKLRAEEELTERERARKDLEKSFRAAKDLRLEIQRLDMDKRELEEKLRAAERQRGICSLQ